MDFVIPPVVQVVGEFHLGDPLDPFVAVLGFRHQLTGKATVDRQREPVHLIGQQDLL